MAKLVSKRYGDALFDLAVEENRVEDMSTEVTQIKEIFADHPELTGLIMNPGIPKEEKLEKLNFSHREYFLSSLSLKKNGEWDDRMREQEL